MVDKPESPEKSASPEAAADIFTEMLRMQGEAARQVMQTFAPQGAGLVPGRETLDAMGAAMLQWQEAWLAPFLPGARAQQPAPLMADPAGWMDALRQLVGAMPLADPAQQQALWGEWLGLCQQILGQYRPGGAEPAPEAIELPRSDRRFANPAWRDQPVFALIHQTYLLLAERIAGAVDSAEGLEERDRGQLRFATKAVLDAMSPANFPLMNPVVLERTIETGGENLVKGMERLSADLERGQLTHSDTSKFTLGENIAATPGKVIYETELFQLIQYAPATEQVIATPLLIFPPWINRFYILDLNPGKSFVRWAVEQGLTVLMVSWRSADGSLAHIGWDDYVRAQIEAIGVVRERLAVPAVHTIGYCVAGTTLAATLAVLARRGEGDQVASATFFTAQVDFAHAGELALLVDDAKIDLIRQASKGGYFDGRYMAATFNMLRGSDLIWNYVVNHYLLGEDYPAFDLLFWNGDVTNLPLLWHEAYLRNLYRDNLLVVPDALSADGTPIDLTRVRTPSYVQAGRDDHIAPAQSVWEIKRHFAGPVRFVLAGSGHIAGVVNPPSANKYQYWLGPDDAAGLDAFIAAAEEHRGSWWPDWLAWIEAQDPARIKPIGRRKPGGKTNPAIEDAPGRYVAMR
jgi:polyhydroxyalkanoate synthase